MSIKQFNFIQKDIKDLFESVSVSELDALKNSSLCIPGGAGFVGTWISEVVNFLNTEHKFNTRVTIVDRDIEKIKTRSPHLLNSKLFDFQRADIRYLVELPKDTNYVIFAAGFPSSHDHTSSPVEVMNSSGLGIDSVLRATDRLSNFKMFMNMSSSSVYGHFFDREKNVAEGDYTYVDETSTSSVYAEAKRYTEGLCSAYRSQFRVPVCTVRPFTLVGPYQSLNSPWALNSFINDAINGKSIKVLGDGETVRSFMYATDMAFWTLKTLLNAESGTKYNLGSSEPVNLRDLSLKVVKHFSVKTDIIYCAGTASAMRKTRMVPDTSKIQDKFNLKVTVPLDKAIERTVQWYLLDRN